MSVPGKWGRTSKLPQPRVALGFGYPIYVDIKLGFYLETHNAAQFSI